MSWFTDIAGKAEDLLNKVDQTAATALQTKSKQPYDGGSPYRKNYDEPYSSPSSYSPSRALPTQTPSSTSLSGRSSLNSQAAVAPKRTPDSDDEKLLQYLNCNESLPSPNRKGKMQLELPVKKSTANVELLPSKGETMDYFKGTCCYWLKLFQDHPSFTGKSSNQVPILFYGNPIDGTI